MSLFSILCLDTSIAECIKEHTDSDEFRDSLTVEQGRKNFLGVRSDFQYTLYLHLVKKIQNTVKTVRVYRRKLTQQMSIEFPNMTDVFFRVSFSMHRKKSCHNLGTISPSMSNKSTLISSSKEFFESFESKNVKTKVCVSFS